MKSLLLLLVSLPLCGCATERLYVKLYDQDGNPATNVRVKVKARNNTSYPYYWGDQDSDYTKFYARSDTNGVACVKFSAPAGSFWWWVDDENYYEAKGHEVVLKCTSEWIPGTTRYLVTLHEHTKSFEEVICRKKNSQMMYYYRPSDGFKKKTPWQNGRYGFDLQEFDWLPPHGKGKVADFYYVRERKDTEEMEQLASTGKVKEIFFHPKGKSDYPAIGDVVGRLEFENGCGAYIKENRKQGSFKTAYCADTNAVYKNSFPITIVESYSKDSLCEKNIIGKDEHMVLRTRVKHNENGEFISAHYSEIVRCLNFNTTPYFFAIVNPESNNTNLEYDSKKKINDEYRIFREKLHKEIEAARLSPKPQKPTNPKIEEKVRKEMEEIKRRTIEARKHRLEKEARERKENAK